MNRLHVCILVLAWMTALAIPCSTMGAQGISLTDPSTGIVLSVHAGSTMPALEIKLPDSPPGTADILVQFPEHVTVTPRGGEPRQVYLFRPGARSPAPVWRIDDHALTTQLDLAGGLRMSLRATLESDGVRYRYEIENTSDVVYTRVQAITDPRLRSARLRDVRLERTYVHVPAGFQLVAADTPERLTMPLDAWLPNRHRIPFRWPIDSQRVVVQPDGIKWYNARAAADEPFIATVSADSAWVVATFSRDPGNLWTNPDLTCQHADPEAPLAAHARVVLEEKTLIVRGTLADVLRRVHAQRYSTRMPKVVVRKRFAISSAAPRELRVSGRQRAAGAHCRA